jgi:hypothetical protein
MDEVDQPDEIVAALNTRPISGQTWARLAALDDLAVLMRIASTSLRTDAPNSGWYLGTICDRLPLAALQELAEQAVRYRAGGPHAAADDLIAYLSLHQPAELTAHLPALWELRPNQRSYYATWPWRAADDREIARLQQIAGTPENPDEERARRCLLQTRRPDVLARLTADDNDLLHVGYTRSREGDLRRLHSEQPWHLAFPPNLLRQWAARHPQRAHHPTWPISSGASTHVLTSGHVEQTCPHCRLPLHRLLRLDPIPPGAGITSRNRVEFVWCPWCGPYAKAGYVRHDINGAPTALPATFVVDPGDPEPGDWFIPATPVALVRLDQRWWQQDWALSNSRDNLHRVGGEPTWIQNAHYPACPDCADTMTSAGQIDIGDLWDGEGICYLMWCDPCAISAVIYQQT